MAAMVMMVIVLASFLQVESRLAQSHAGYLRARFNALASARIAIGQLQQLAGPDQRVTMRADMYADNDVAVGNNDATTTGPVRGRTDRANNNAPTKTNYPTKSATSLASGRPAASTPRASVTGMSPTPPTLVSSWVG